MECIFMIQNKSIITLKTKVFTFLRGKFSREWDNECLHYNNYLIKISDASPISLYCNTSILDNGGLLLCIFL